MCVYDSNTEYSNDGYTVATKTATHCNTLQHTATHCNTLQHTATLYRVAKYLVRVWFSVRIYIHYILVNIVVLFLRCEGEVLSLRTYIHIL